LILVFDFESCAFLGSLVGVRLRLRRGFIVAVNFVLFESCAFVRSLPLVACRRGLLLSRNKRSKNAVAPHKNG